MITNNQIYTEIADAVTTAFPSAYCSSRIEPIPDHFPAVYIRMIGYTIPQETYSLNFDGHAERPTLEVQIFSNKENGALSEAYAIMEVVKSAMTGMYFLCDFIEPIDNIDPSVFRLASRWHRIIGDGEVLPDENT
jgi:hypothetical protein